MDYLVSIDIVPKNPGTTTYVSIILYHGHTLLGSVITPLSALAATVAGDAR